MMAGLTVYVIAVPETVTVAPRIGPAGPMRSTVVAGPPVADRVMPMELTGFNADALGMLMTQVSPPTEFGEVNENIVTEHECPKCKYRWSGGHVRKGEDVGS